MAAVLQHAATLAQVSCALEDQLRKGCPVERGMILLLYWFYTGFMVYTGKQKGRIHLVVLHVLPPNNFSLLRLGMSQNQNSESQFIQIPKEFRME